MAQACAHCSSFSSNTLSVCFFTVVSIHCVRNFSRILVKGHWLSATQYISSQLLMNQTFRYKNPRHFQQRRTSQPVLAVTFFRFIKTRLEKCFFFLYLAWKHFNTRQRLWQNSYNLLLPTQWYSLLFQKAPTLHFLNSAVLELFNSSFLSHTSKTLLIIRF